MSKNCTINSVRPLKNCQRFTTIKQTLNFKKATQNLDQISAYSRVIDDIICKTLLTCIGRTCVGMVSKSIRPTKEGLQHWIGLNYLIFRYSPVRNYPEGQGEEKSF